MKNKVFLIKIFFPKSLNYNLCNNNHYLLITYYKIEV